MFLFKQKLTLNELQDQSFTCGGVGHAEEIWRRKFINEEENVFCTHPNIKYILIVEAVREN